jgi:hypothetical protein
MESIQESSDTSQPGAEKRLTFDQHLQQLPASKQSIHRWLGWLVIVALVLTLGVFVYAIYTSITWKSAGGENVVVSWMYFFLAGAIAAFLLGLDTLLVGATIPPPFERSKYSFETGSKAVKEGWWMIGYGLVMSILVFVGVAAVRAGRFSVEDWITLVVGFFVILGIGSGVLAIFRKILQSRST